jgi:predicted 3-demethylubiquinone-9 3-methyltransferase (glyoxalase superfamily)
MQKITPFLWFDDKAEDAANFYVSIFPNSRIIEVARYSDAGPAPAGSVMTVTFSLDGQELIALNGGPHFKLSHAVSLFVSCETQEEVDVLWEKLLAGGGAPSQCGWLVDRYGLSWQIIPRVLLELTQDKDPARAKRVAEAMFKMIKIDIAALRKAHAGS